MDSKTDSLFYDCRENSQTASTEDLGFSRDTCRCLVTHHIHSIMKLINAICRVRLTFAWTGIFYDSPPPPHTLRHFDDVNHLFYILANILWYTIFMQFFCVYLVIINCFADWLLKYFAKTNELVCYETQADWNSKYLPQSSS